jgi:OOP family OmpA-OmpF porin
MTSFTFSKLGAAVAIAFCPLLAGAADMAQNPAYLVDGAGAVVKAVDGSCWHTGAWTPAQAAAPCDGMLAAAAVMPLPMPAPKVAEAATVPVAVPTAVVVLPVVPAQQKISFSGDALFAFDKAELRPESRALLDGLVRQLQGTTSDTISIVGHTDRLGSAKYNQKLSEQRALAVRDYLMSNNLQASSMSVKGMGEALPVSAATECTGAKATSKLVACLQPDRRVDIEMKGTRVLSAAH